MLVYVDIDILKNSIQELEQKKKMKKWMLECLCIWDGRKEKYHSKNLSGDILNLPL